jgi:20S proteasome subunit beta 6
MRVYYLRFALAIIGTCLLKCVVVESNDFDPYAANGGLVSAVAGKDFCIIAADTRMSGSGYLLHSRNHVSSRLWTVSDDPIMAQVEETLRRSSHDSSSSEASYSPVVERQLLLSQAPVLIGSSGCTADCRALQSDLRADLRAASHFGQTKIQDPNQVATSLSQMLYQRRGFPYYAFCVAAALDSESQRGNVYVYDAIGSYEQVAVATSGTGREALQPILDRMFESSRGSPLQVEGTASNAVRKLCEAYRSVSEREIEVGDKLVLHVSEVLDDGMVNCKVIVAPLKED